MLSLTWGQIKEDGLRIAMNCTIRSWAYGCASGCWRKLVACNRLVRHRRTCSNSQNYIQHISPEILFSMTCPGDRPQILRSTFHAAELEPNSWTKCSFEPSGGLRCFSDMFWSVVAERCARSAGAGRSKAPQVAVRDHSRLTPSLEDIILKERGSLGRGTKEFR